MTSVLPNPDVENRVPTSTLCIAAFDYARRVYPEFLLNHCIRSFVFADAAGQHEGRSFNRDLLYVACLLHDLGITSEVPVNTRFEVEGADAARQFLAEHGVGSLDQELVWDAIALHTTLVVPQRKQAEVALCQLGAAIDVGFAPTSLLNQALVADTLRSYPRLGFKRAIVESFCGLLQRNPQAASLSVPVAQVGERHIHGFSCPHFCDVLAAAGFDD